MADASEDLVLRDDDDPPPPTQPTAPTTTTSNSPLKQNTTTAKPSNGGDDDDNSSDNDSDTAPDYSALLQSLGSASAQTTITLGGALPKRGNKDFEPHATSLQQSTLARSRAAMAAALQPVRVHAAKTHVQGVYDGRTGVTLIRKPRGQLFTRIGRDVTGGGGGVELAAEEALWALERGALDIAWACDSNSNGVGEVEDGQDGEQLQDEPEADDTRAVTMSLQAAYAAYIGGGWGLSAEKYVVYAGLKRAGFVVMRAEGFDGVRRRRRQASNKKSTDRCSSWWDWIRHVVFDESETSKQQRLATGPLVKPGLYRGYGDIYGMLRIVPTSERVQSAFEKPEAGREAAQQKNRGAGGPQQVDKVDLEAGQSDEEGEEEHTPFTTTYNIYKPLPNFRKSAPGPPAFRVCVVSARDTRLPSLAELDALLKEQPADPPPAHMQPPPPGGPSSAGRGRGGNRGAGIGGVYNRLKYGQCNVLLAVVDQGVVSYMRINEAPFADERLYERVGPAAGGRGGKGGQRGGGRGRGGRGRGR